MSLTSRRARRCALIARELPERDGRERGVLAVGGEQPRVVGVAGADERDARHGADRGRERLALGDVADLQVARRLREVGEVLLAPLDRVLEAAVAGQIDARAVRERLARTWSSPRSFAAGSLSAAVRSWRVAATETQTVSVAPARDGHAVGELAARALAERAVVAGERRDLVAVLADRAGARAAEAGADGVGRGGAVGRGDGGERAVAEDERAVLEGGGVLAVGRGRRRGRAPRVGGHQLGVHVDLDRHGLGPAPRVLERAGRTARRAGRRARSRCGVRSRPLSGGRS